MIMKREDPQPSLEQRMGEALYALYTELGGDVDGAKDYKDLFGALVSPSIKDLMLEELKARLETERDQKAYPLHIIREGLADVQRTMDYSDDAIALAYWQAQATLALAEQQRATNVLALTSSTQYINRDRMMYNIEKEPALQAKKDRIISVLGVSPDGD